MAGSNKTGINIKLFILLFGKKIYVIIFQCGLESFVVQRILSIFDNLKYFKLTIKNYSKDVIDLYLSKNVKIQHVKNP